MIVLRLPHAKITISSICARLLQIRLRQRTGKHTHADTSPLPGGGIWPRIHVSPGGVLIIHQSGTGPQDLVCTASTVPEPTATEDWTSYVLDSNPTVFSAATEIIAGPTSIALQYYTTSRFFAQSMLEHPDELVDWSVHTGPNASASGKAAMIWQDEGHWSTAYSEFDGVDYSLRFATSEDEFPGSSLAWDSYLLRALTNVEVDCLVHDGKPLVANEEPDKLGFQLFFANEVKPDSANDWNTYVLDAPSPVGAALQRDLLANWNGRLVHLSSNRGVDSIVVQRPLTLNPLAFEWYQSIVPAVGNLRFLGRYPAAIEHQNQLFIVSSGLTASADEEALLISTPNGPW